MKAKSIAELVEKATALQCCMRRLADMNSTCSGPNCMAWRLEERVAYRPRPQGKTITYLAWCGLASKAANEHDLTKDEAVLAGNSLPRSKTLKAE